MLIDNYTSAIFSITGMTFDSVGGLYLAYDLLGGERGPLSRLTRCATYSFIAVLFYALTFNIKFGLICGVGMGSIIGWHLHMIASERAPSKFQLVLIALCRMLIIGVGTSMVVSKAAAIILGIAAFFGSLTMTKMKFSPEHWYEASRKPSFSWRRLSLGLVIGTFFAAAAFLGETISGVSVQPALLIGLHLGLVMGIGTSLIAAIIPFVEWYADNLPPKRMGYIGAVMFLIGFVIQAMPSLLVVFSQ